MAKSKHVEHYQLYDLWWEKLLDPAAREIYMIQQGGEFKKRDGGMAGKGLLFHYQELQKILWPEKKHHRWSELLLKSYLDYKIIGVMGPASSGKTHEAALFGLCTYYAFSDQITILCSSTEIERLEMRVWGEIKSYHKKAKSRFDWLPGHLIESRQRLLTDTKQEGFEGRDFRNGMCGIPCKKSGQYVGIGAYVGVKNKKVLLIADEGSFMPRAYLDAISNLGKNPWFKCIAMGNPLSTTDALGLICEPSAELGGWECGIDQTPGSKTWTTRFNKGVCVQLTGSDSPNLDGTLGIDLITQEHIDADIKFYGKDSLQFTSMNEARMPRSEGARRVITRPMAKKFKAMEPVVWKDNNQTRIAFLDAAYGNTGGDRCIFGEMDFGTGIVDGKERQILALICTMLVPVSVQQVELPEDQIALFCMDQCKTRNIPPENFFFDSTGKGTLMAAFARLWSPQVQPVEFGGKPSESIVSDAIKVKCCDYYYKKVSELWFSVRLVVEAGQWRGMTEEALEELSMREWTLTSTSKVEVEPKFKTKERMGRSPDIGDAVVVGCEGARRKGFVIARLSNPKSTALTNNFKERVEARLAKLRKSWELTYS